MGCSLCRKRMLWHEPMGTAVMTNDAELKSQVTRSALQDRSWMKNPHLLNSVTEAQAVSRLNIEPIPMAGVFKRVRFFVVTDPTEKPGIRSLIIAISGDNEAQRICSLDDFQRLLIENHLSIRSNAEALLVAEFYVQLLGT